MPDGMSQGVGLAKQADIIHCCTGGSGPLCYNPKQGCIV